MFLLYLMFRVKFSQEGGSVASLMDKKHASNTTRLYCVSYFIHFLPLIKRKAVLSKLLHTITDKPLFLDFSSARVVVVLWKEVQTAKPN